jgi:hypothetical protein
VKRELFLPDDRHRRHALRGSGASSPHHRPNLISNNYQLLQAAESAVASAFLEVIPRNEFLVSGDPEWVTGLISAYNKCYAWGFKGMTILLVIILLVFAPFVGLFSAAWSFAGAIFRQGALVVGRLV